MTLLIRRKYIEKILQYQNMGTITILKGVRYSGKSTILKQTYEELKKRGIPQENIKFIDFVKEGHDFQENSMTLSKLLDSSNKIKGNKYIFIDNIEYVNNWGRILHYRCKYRYDLNVYIAPINSSHMTNENIREIAYKHEIEIFPFSFREVLDYYKLNSNKKLKNLSENELFEEYQKYGGLPEVLDLKDTETKNQIIIWSYNDTLNPNIYNLYFKNFAKSFTKYLIETMGEEFNTKIFQSFVNRDSNGYFNMFNLSYELLTYYLNIISNIELIKACGDIDLVNNDYIWHGHKYYVPDPSFYFLCPYAKLNSKEILESLVFAELLRRDYKVARGVLDNDDITFVHNNRKEITFIQIEESIEEEEIRKKTLDKLNKVKGNKYIISTDRTDYSQEGVKHVNIIDFLKDENMITNYGD